MTDFLSDLLRRSRGQAGGLAPRLPSLFEPVAEAAQAAADEPLPPPAAGWPPPVDPPAPAPGWRDDPGRPTSDGAMAPPPGAVAARGPADDAPERPPAARPELVDQRLDELEWQLAVPAETPPPERRPGSPEPARPRARAGRPAPAATTARTDAAAAAPGILGAPRGEVPARDRPDRPPPPVGSHPPRPGRLTAPAPPDPPAVGPRRPQPPPAAGDPAPPPTVRVTIGRVEIRAVPGPPPARRPPAARATSLDDYLSERNRRRQA
jgi:hypothetical protein